MRSQVVHFEVIFMFNPNHRQLEGEIPGLLSTNHGTGLQVVMFMSKEENFLLLKRTLSWFYVYCLSIWNLCSFVAGARLCLIKKSEEGTCLVLHALPMQAERWFQP